MVRKVTACIEDTSNLAAGFRKWPFYVQALQGGELQHLRVQGMTFAKYTFLERV